MDSDRALIALNFPCLGFPCTPPWRRGAEEAKHSRRIKVCPFFAQAVQRNEIPVCLIGGRVENADGGTVCAVIIPPSFCTALLWHLAEFRIQLLTAWIMTTHRYCHQLLSTWRPPMRKRPFVRGNTWAKCGLTQSSWRSSLPPLLHDVEVELAGGKKKWRLGANVQSIEGCCKRKPIGDVIPRRLMRCDLRPFFPEESNEIHRFVIRGLIEKSWGYTRPSAWLSSHSTNNQQANLRFQLPWPI